MGGGPLLAHNLALLRRHQPNIAARLSEAAPHPQADEPQADQALTQAFQLAQSESRDFLFLAGLPLGDAWLQAIRPFLRENRGVLILEPEAGRLTAWLGAVQAGWLLRSRRVFWAIGADALSQAESRLQECLGYMAARPLFWLHPQRQDLQPLMQSLQAFIQRERASMNARLKALPGRLQEANPWPPRIWSFEDLRGVAGYSSIQNTLMRMLHFELRRLGCETEYLVMRDGRYYPPYYRILRLALFEPTLVFLCNKSPSYDICLGAQFSRSLPIRKLTWFADDPYYAEHLLERNGTSEDEAFLVADWDWMHTLERHGARRIGFMPGGVTKTRRGRKRSTWRCEVMFVGQIRDQRAFFTQLSPGWRRYCEAVIAAKLRSPRMNVHAAMQQASMPAPLPADRLDELRQHILWEANTRFRLRVVQQLAPYDLRIYGNAAWQHLLPPELAKRAYRGLLPQGRLFEAYRNARIALNIHSLQSCTCLNVRDFDVPAAGGFLLSDWLPRADDVFRPGFVDDLPLDEHSSAEVFFYRSAAELRQLADYFLTHETERQACLERARQTVLAHHTYRHRARFLWQTLSDWMTEPDPA